ncbi:urease accessory protein UreD [Duganella sp. FT3S]|uniref:Urease accessory protein UreD n=1 Tax=Rugamonas fusca TaxID=2758568 RepID=A0A7W2EHW3_9BURK|nr:urease accessory protein UreD [Rugamonas fusca]MBA5606211.1 urease accessory protein UreD [Rugamonas fusca]
MPDCIAPTGLAASHSAWQASLALGFADDAGTTRLIDNTHCGPLRVQKPLYPEGGAVCHAIIVHPPGGVVGGDQLSIAATVGAHARALLTTPGAAKWYKANGKRSAQQVRLDVGPGAALEWLPQEAIFFDQADVALDQTITLAADACYIGCEILCMGRRASGETFATGRVAQRTRIRRDDKLIWWEQGALNGGRLDSPLTLNSHTVCATLIAIGPPLPASVLTELRAELGDDPHFGITQAKGLLVARHLGDDSEIARRTMLAVWRRVRPHLLGREAITPRIWQT